MNEGRFEAEPAIYKPIDQRLRLLVFECAKLLSVLMLFYSGLRSTRACAASAAVPTEVRSIVLITEGMGREVLQIKSV